MLGTARGGCLGLGLRGALCGVVRCCGGSSSVAALVLGGGLLFPVLCLVVDIGASSLISESAISGTLSDGWFPSRAGRGGG